MSFQYTLFDTLLEPVFVLNAERKVVYCNETAAIVCDLTVRKITRGLVFDTLFEFSEPIEALKNLAAVTEPLPYKELNFTTSTGQQGKVQITLQPITSPEGENHWIVFVRDVTLEERLQKKYRAELEQKEDVIKALEQAKEKLEDYSKNLEQKVAERTKEISSLNQKMKALLDSLGQGFFIFNQEGLCLEVNSKACQDTVESLPAGQMIWDVLKVPAAKVDGFKKWMMTVFSEMLPFNDLAPLGPNVFPHSQGKNIALEYFPLRSNEGQMEGVVVVASDITSLVEAQRQAETEKEHAKLIINLVKSKKEISRFIRDSESLLHDLNNELSRPVQDYEAVYRYLHTLKGGAASFSVQEMAEVCHSAENQVNLYKEQTTPDAFAKLKELCAGIGAAFARFLGEAEEILGGSALSSDRQIEIPSSKLNLLLEKIRALPRGSLVAQLLVSELMMEPVGSFFEPYKELSLRTAEKEGKALLPIVFHHGEIPVMPEIYSPLFATFVHAFRNGVDHGIEFPSEREERGKKPEGRIEVFFELTNNGQDLKICVKDDGGGVNPAKIRARLEQKGVSTEKESDPEVIQHIFDSQFSTREVVTETSGRGVGMDAIKAAATALGGKVWVESTLGQGTSLFVVVPYQTELPVHLKAA